MLLCKSFTIHSVQYGGVNCETISAMAEFPSRNSLVKLECVSFARAFWTVLSSRLLIFNVRGPHTRQVVRREAAVWLGWGGSAESIRTVVTGRSQSLQGTSLWYNDNPFVRIHFHLWERICGISAFQKSRSGLFRSLCRFVHIKKYRQMHQHIESYENVTKMNV